MSVGQRNAVGTYITYIRLGYLCEHLRVANEIPRNCEREVSQYEGYSSAYTYVKLQALQATQKGNRTDRSNVLKLNLPGLAIITRRPLASRPGAANRYLRKLANYTIVLS